MSELQMVDQDRFGAEGNCFAACFATLFGLSLSEVMSWYRSGDAHAGQWVSSEMSRWLDERGLCYVEVPRGNLTSNATDEPKRETSILGWSPLFSPLTRPRCFLCGPSPRFPGMQHVVVGRTNGWLYEIEHDPHPDRAGLRDVTAIGFFVRTGHRGDQVGS